MQMRRYVRRKRGIRTRAIRDGEAESGQIAGRLRPLVLHRVPWNIRVVLRALGAYMLRRKLSFLCGRRRESELPLQLCVRLWEQGREREVEVEVEIEMEVAERLS